MPSHCCNNVYIFFMTVLTSEPEQQQQQHPSEDGGTKTNLVQTVAEKKQLLQLKQDPSPAISITTTSAVATTGPSGVITQCMSSGHDQRF